MSNFEQHELGFPGARAANLRLRRGIYLLPSLLTVANMVCGFYAVMSTLKGELSDLDTAAKAIGFAIVFDSFDGFVARATGTSSEFGKQFDSLADMVSFGIAPAVLAFTWGVRGILQSDVVDIRQRPRAVPAVRQPTASRPPQRVTTRQATTPTKAPALRLTSENAALKKGASTGIRMKVSEKGAVSIYGMGRFPVTLYKEQWLKLLDMSADIRAFIDANEAKLKAKD